MKNKPLYVLVGAVVGACVALRSIPAVDAEPTPPVPDTPATTPDPAGSSRPAIARLVAGLGQLSTLVQRATEEREPSLPEVSGQALEALDAAIQRYAQDEVQALWVLRRLTGIIEQEPTEFLRLLQREYGRSLDQVRPLNQHPTSLPA